MLLTFVSVATAVGPATRKQKTFLRGGRIVDPTPFVEPAALPRKFTLSGFIEGYMQAEQDEEVDEEDEEDEERLLAKTVDTGLIPFKLNLGNDVLKVEASDHEMVDHDATHRIVFVLTNSPVHVEINQQESVEVKKGGARIFVKKEDLKE